MPEFELSPGTKMFYRDDDFTDPWVTAEPLFLLHGIAESGETYNRWMPELARRFRVIRPDMRGFGRSTKMPVEYPWTMDGVVDDFVKLADHLGIERFHLVAGKIGGAIALHFAASKPQRVRTLVSVAPRTLGKASVNAAPETLRKIADEGVEKWARASMGSRLGSGCSPEMFEGWVRHMGQTAPSTLIGFMGTLLPQVDVRPDLPKITAPTLIITTEGSALGSVDAVRAWQEKIAGSELLVLPGDSYHVCATHPDECVRASIDFIERNRVAAGG